MIIKFLQKNKTLRNLVFNVAQARAKKVVSMVEKYFKKNEKILDIGCGTCNVLKILIEKGINVIPLDVKNLSFDKQINPVIYDGKNIPFPDDNFDTSLILFVLHHALDPIQILKEAARVSKKIIIFEDIYNNVFEKFSTFFFDCLHNFDFISNPHNNKKDKEWREIFQKQGLKLLEVKYSFYFPFRQVIYCLEKK